MATATGGGSALGLGTSRAPYEAAGQVVAERGAQRRLRSSADRVAERAEEDVVFLAAGGTRMRASAGGRGSGGAWDCVRAGLRVEERNQSIDERNQSID